MAERGITFVLTSCGRVDLLKRTIESFDQFNSYPITRFIITEDSCDPAIYKEVEALFGERMEIHANQTKKGQIKSCIDAYDTIETEFVYHCEDDWRFFKPGFIEESIAILDSDPLISQVVIRSAEDLNSHNHVFNFGEVQEVEGYQFRKMVATGSFEWGHFSFNPGIKRISDHHQTGGFKNCHCELDINLKWRDAGYYAVISETPGVEHLGDDRAVYDPTRKWTKRRKPGKPKGIKRLWGHLKAGKF